MGPGDDDEDGFRPAPLPDDRIWRHPSELAQPAATASFGPVPRPRVWPVALAALAVGTALTLGVVDAAERSLPSASRLSLTRLSGVTPTTTLSGMVNLEAPSGERLGDGMLFRSDGHVLAAAHVLAGMGSVTVVLHDGRRLAARLLGVDGDTDIAVLKADVDSPMPTVPATKTTLQVASTPIEVALVVASDIATSGHRDSCWLGVAGDDGKLGAVLDEVAPGGPAALAGLAPGDEVVALEGAPVRSIAELRVALQRWHAGDTVRVAYRRDGVRRLVPVVLSARPPA